MTERAYRLTIELRKRPEVARLLGKDWLDLLCGPRTPQRGLATGGLCRVAEADWRDLRIARASAAGADEGGHLPYVPRGSSQAKLARAIQQSIGTPGATVVVLQGPPGAGKKRLAFEMLREIAPHAWIIAPEGRGTVEAVYHPDSHHELVGNSEPTVVWLDNLELFVADTAGDGPGLLPSHIASLRQPENERSSLVVCTIGGKGRLRADGAARAGELSIATAVQRLVSLADFVIDVPYELDENPSADVFDDATRAEIARIGIGPYATQTEVVRAFYTRGEWPLGLDAPSGDHREGLALADALIAWRIGFRDDPVRLTHARTLWEVFRAHRDLHGPPTDANWDVAIRWATAPVVRFSPIASCPSASLIDVNDMLLEVADHVALVTHLNEQEPAVVTEAEIDPFEVGTRLRLLVPTAAEKWYRRGVCAGDRRCMVNLGALLIEKDASEEATALFERAAALGEPTALQNLAAIVVESDPDRAEALFRQAADAGVGLAMTNLSHLLWDRDRDEAWDWLMRAYELREPHALVRVAGNLDDERRDEAIAILGAAADQGHAEAQARLALLIMDDDPVVATQLLRFAVGGGFVPAHRMLAGMVHEADPDQAEWLLRRAIDLGDVDSIYVLAQLLADTDSQASLHLLREADAAGCTDATVELAARCEGQEPAEARTLYERAAAGGNADAMYRLGQLAAESKPKEALDWYKRAAALDHPAATYELARDLLSRHDGRSLEFLERAAVLGHPFARNALAVMHCKRAPDQADAVVDTVIADGDGYAITQLGFLFLMDDDPQRAAVAFRAASELGVADAAYQLALLVSATDPEAAVGLLVRAADLGNPAAREIVERVAPSDKGKPNPGGAAT